MNLPKSLIVLILISIFSIITDGQTTQREVAVTIDDLPATQGDYASYKYITDKLLAKLKAEKIPAIGFVNEKKLGAGKDQEKYAVLLKRWLDDGHELGNHTFTHVYIDRVTFEQYTADLIRGENVTKKLLAERGKTLKYFRHPQLRTGPTEEYRRKLNDLLARRGYTVAPVTIDNNDFLFAEAFLRAKAKNDKDLQAKIGAAYIEYMSQIFEHFENLSREFLGREVRQTLLLHASELNADYFDKLAQMLKNRGYKFITLEEALKDEAYKLPEAQSKRGLSWIHRWMLAKNLEMKEEPREPAWIGQK